MSIKKVMSYTLHSKDTIVTCIVLAICMVLGRCHVTTPQEQLFFPDTALEKYSELCRCVEDGERQEAYELITSYVYTPGRLGCMLPHEAAWRGDIRIMSLLIHYGIDVDKMTSKLWTPLHIATLFKHVDIVQMLIDAGSDVNLRNNDDETALHIAARRCCQEIVDTLVKHGAFLNVYDTHGRMPIFSAVIYGCREIVMSLLRHGSYIDPGYLRVLSYEQGANRAESKSVFALLKNTCAENIQVNRNIALEGLESVMAKGAQVGVIFCCVDDIGRQELLQNQACSRYVYHSLRERNMLSFVINVYNVPSSWLLYAIEHGDVKIAKRMLNRAIMRYCLHYVAEYSVLPIIIQRNYADLLKQILVMHIYIEPCRCFCYRLLSALQCYRNTYIEDLARRYIAVSDVCEQLRLDFGALQKHGVFKKTKCSVFGALPSEMMHIIMCYLIHEEF